MKISTDINSLSMEEVDIYYHETPEAEIFYSKHRATYSDMDAKRLALREYEALKKKENENKEFQERSVTRTRIYILLSMLLTSIIALFAYLR